MQHQRGLGLEADLSLEEHIAHDKAEERAKRKSSPAAGPTPEAVASFATPPQIPPLPIDPPVAKGITRFSQKPLAGVKALSENKLGV